MKKSKYKVISNKKIQRKIFFVTFSCFLFAVLVVVGIFYLVSKKSEIKWLEGSDGLARERLFPLVFTSDEDIFVLNEDGSVEEVDNDIKNAVYDTNLEKVYYVYKGTNDLYEYSVEKGSREKLCGGVSSFYLFEERTYIPYISTDGSLYIYSYNTKMTFLIRENDENMPEELTAPVIGKNLVMYFDEYDAVEGTATLFCLKSDGKGYQVAHDVIPEKGVVITTDDSAVCYYTEAGLTIRTLPNLYEITYENSFPVSSTSRMLDEDYDIYAPTSFDSCFNVKYVVTENDNENSLSYIHISSKKITSKSVSDKVTNIIGYSEDTEMLLFTHETEDEIEVYLSEKGGEPKLITTCEKNTTFNYDPDSYKLYMTSTEGTVSLLSVNERVKKQYVVAEKASKVYTYYGKKFAIAANENGVSSTFIFSQYRQEQSNKNERRLYGVSDENYLLQRTYEDGTGISLDIVIDGSFTRVCGDVENTIVFDKKFENIVYQSGDTLYLYNNGTSRELAKLNGVFVPVSIVAKK